MKEIFFKCMLLFFNTKTKLFESLNTEQYNVKHFELFLEPPFKNITHNNMLLKLYKLYNNN